MLPLLRRAPLALVIFGVLSAVACTSGTATTPTAPASKPTAAPAISPAAPTTSKPAAAASPESKPAASPAAKVESQITKPGVSADWQASWDAALAGAKNEGRVVVASGRGELYTKALMAFEKAYPDIKLELSGFTGPDFVPKLLSEREGGQFLWDVWLSGWNPPVPLKNRGIMDPIKPMFTLPEVLDDSKWLGGFDDGWVDVEHQYQFQFSSYLNFLAYVNTDMLTATEMKSVDTLLDPKWKGKIAMIDPRVNGAASTRTSFMLVMRGEDWVRKLLSQDVVVVSESRQLAEGMVRGRYPIAIGLNVADFENFSQEGLMAKIKPLAPDTPEGKRINSGFGNANLLNKAPHPNAAKLFINWLLSKDGQTTYVQTTGVNSRRLDTPQLPDRAPDPKTKYEVPEKENSELFVAGEKAIEMAKDILK